jgi:diguanylate cyclase (GGDEF)-like protein
MSGPPWFPNKIEQGLGKLENAYHEHYFSANMTQATFGLFIYNVLLLYFLRADYIFFGFGEMFQLLFAGRLLFIVVSVFVFFHFHKGSSYLIFEKVSAAMLFAGILLNHFINLSRPRDYMDYVPIGIISLFMVYFVFPLHIKWRFGVAIFSTLLEFQNLDTKIISTSIWVSVVLAYVLANLIGLFISGWFYSLRRYNFVLLQRQRSANKRLERLAMQDSLTGAKNRRYFISQGSMEIERSQRYYRPVTMAILDMDNFKSINDVHGHMVGDLAISKFVDMVNANIRKPDIFARIGGDEFGLIMPETNEAEARDILGRLRSFVQSQIVLIPNAQIKLSFTAGFAQSKEAESISELMAIADKDLYQEKSKRDRITPVSFSVP